MKVDLDALVKEKIEFITKHKEKLVEAWVAETGYLPSESVLMVQDEFGPKSKIWVEKKYPGLPKNEYPKMDALIKELRLAREVAPELSWRSVKDHNGYFYDGAEFLCALQVTNNKTNKTKWEFHTIAMRCDETVDLEHLVDGAWEYFSDWTWDCFEYYIPLNKEALQAYAAEEVE